MFSLIYAFMLCLHSLHYTAIQQKLMNSMSILFGTDTDQEIFDFSFQLWFAAFP